MKTGNSYLVILPTFNEADNIQRIVPLILEQDSRISVLIVHDDSPDRTGELADILATKYTRVHVLHRSG